jgi:hypothetical protein
MRPWIVVSDAKVEDELNAKVEDELPSGCRSAGMAR